MKCMHFWETDQEYKYSELKFFSIDYHPNPLVSSVLSSSFPHKFSATLTAGDLAWEMSYKSYCFWILGLFTTGQASLQCYLDYECELQSVSRNDTVECYGFSSCINSILIETISQALIECSGSYSCYNSSLIHHNDHNQTANIMCMFNTMHYIRI